MKYMKIVLYLLIMWELPDRLVNEWEKRTYMCTVCLLADKIRSRRAREKTFHLWKRLSHVFVCLLVWESMHVFQPASRELCWYRFGDYQSCVLFLQP